MITEQYVSFDTAKLLKEAGFDVPVYNFYEYIGEYVEGRSDRAVNYNKENHLTSRPTQSLAARWIREVHNLHVWCELTKYTDWFYCIDKINPYVQYYIVSEPSFISFEKALEAGLQEALRIIIKKQTTMKRIFRGKDALTKQWVYGDLMHINGGCILFTGDHEHAGITKHEDIAVSFSHEEISVVYANTVGQYTGLHDSEGKYIYEGDVIVGMYGYLHIVRYNARMASYTAILIDDNFHGDLQTECYISQAWIDEDEKRVCGNVYDNPEFLK